MIRKIERRFLAPGSYFHFKLMRVVFAATMAVRFARGGYEALSSQPHEVFRQPWFLEWLGRIPDPELLVGVQIVGVIAAACVLVDRKPQMAFGVLWFAYLFLTGLETSFGKVLHNDVLLLIAAIPVVLSSVGRVSWKDRHYGVAAGWPRRLSLLIVAVAYFAAGYQKMRSAGFDWAFSDNMRWILYQAAAGDNPVSPAFTVRVGNTLWLTKALAAGALSLELLFPLVLVARRVRPFFAASAIIMHGSIWLLVGLDYLPWMMAVIIVLVPWAPWTEQGNEASRSSPAMASPTDEMARPG